MAKDNKIYFNKQAHEWSAPQFYANVEDYKKGLLENGFYKDRPEDLDEELKKHYENIVLSEAMRLNPSMFRSGISDNLLFDDEMDLDSSLMKDFEDYYGKKVKSVDDIPEREKNYLLIQRMRVLGTPSFERLRDVASYNFNEDFRREEDKWNYQPQFTGPKPFVEQTPAPSRLHSLGVTGQKIDPNYPLFLQIPNPHIPWGVNHPLRKMFVEQNASKVGLDDYTAQLDMLDAIGGGITSDYNPFWRTSKYPELTRALEARHIRGLNAQSYYPKYYRPEDDPPYGKWMSEPSPYQKSIIDLLKDEGEK